MSFISNSGKEVRENHMENFEIQLENSKHNGSRFMPHHPERAVTELEGPAGTRLLLWGVSWVKRVLWTKCGHSEERAGVGSAWFLFHRTPRGAERPWKNLLRS